MIEWNPYAPPEVIEDRPQWRREGDFILVREGSSLPPIDLESGSKTHLISVKRHFIRRSTAYQLANIFIPMSLFLPTEWKLLSLPIAIVLSSLTAIAMWALPRWSALRLSFIAQSVQFQYFREASRLRASIRYQWIFGLVITFLISIGALVAYLVGDNADEYLIWLMMPMVVTLLYIGTRMNPSRLFMIAAPEGWVKIGGVHRNVIERLAGMTQ